MKKQDFKTHVRYYPPHHFVFYPVITFLLYIAIKHANSEDANKTIWWTIAAIIMMVGWLSFMLRQHYALTLQNRLVRLEMRYRYYRLTQKAFEPLELQLSFGQIAALRFAGDEELLMLIERTISEQLSPSTIKKSIRYWTPDYMRV